MLTKKKEQAEITKDIRKWIGRYLTDGSVNSYITYINNSKTIICKYLQDDFSILLKDDVDRFFKIKYSESKSNKEYFANQCAFGVYLLNKEIDLVKKNDIKKKTTYKYSDIQKYKSGFLALVDFMQNNNYIFESTDSVFGNRNLISVIGKDYINTYGTKEIEEEISNHSKKPRENIAGIYVIKNTDLNYKKETVIYNFVFRLMTQDRIYPEQKLVFPIRILNSYYKKDELESFVAEQVKNDLSVIVDSTGVKKKFNEYRDGTDFYRKKGKWYVDKDEIYTGVFAKETLEKLRLNGTPVRKGDYVSMNYANSKRAFLDQLSLDHDKPLHKEICKKKYKCIAELSKAIYNLKPEVSLDDLKSSSFSKELKGYLENKKELNFRSELLEELKEIFRGEYVLMETGENSAKNDNE